MKNRIVLLLTILLMGPTFAQTDKNGNPVFNSVSTTEKKIDNFLLISNYYMLKNNIDNKQSSVYIAKKPSLNQIEKAAINLASDFFILTKESKMVLTVTLLNEPNRAFLAIIMSNKKQLTFPCDLMGDITENRANEIIKEKYDTTAAIENGKLKFNGKLFSIITNQAIENAVWKLIKDEKIDKKKQSDIILPSKTELKNYILAETKEGGRLDHFTEIKGKEFNGVQVKSGVFTTMQGIALYKWGRDCYNLGVNTIDDVYEIFAEFKQRELNEKDKAYIKLGFEKEWEK